MFQIQQSIKSLQQWCKKLREKVSALSWWPKGSLPLGLILLPFSSRPYTSSNDYRGSTHFRGPPMSGGGGGGTFPRGYKNYNNYDEYNSMGRYPSGGQPYRGNGPYYVSLHSCSASCFLIPWVADAVQIISTIQQNTSYGGGGGGYAPRSRGMQNRGGYGGRGNYYGSQELQRSDSYHHDERDKAAPIS